MLRFIIVAVYLLFALAVDQNRNDSAMEEATITVKILPDDGTFPNNEALPLLLYTGALRLPGDGAAEAVERAFSENGWGGMWRNGIYGYHHYHSTAHEVLGVYAGWAEVQLGGPSGLRTRLQKGDVVVIPAGVAHKNLDQSDDFQVVGAYPPGQRWDMNYGKPGERPSADKNIAQVPLPEHDPVYGSTGPLLEHWHAKR